MNAIQAVQTDESKRWRRYRARIENVAATMIEEGVLADDFRLRPLYSAIEVFENRIASLEYDGWVAETFQYEETSKE